MIKFELKRNDKVSKSNLQIVFHKGLHDHHHNNQIIIVILYKIKIVC